DAIPADLFGPQGPEGTTRSHLEDADPGKITRECGQATVVRQDELRIDEPRGGAAARGTDASGRLELREGGAPLRPEVIDPGHGHVRPARGHAGEGPLISRETDGIRAGDLDDAHGRRLILPLGGVSGR